MLGANVGIFCGVVKRLANNGNFGAQGMCAVLIDLDEHLYKPMTVWSMVNCIVIPHGYGTTATNANNSVMLTPMGFHF